MLNKAAQGCGRRQPQQRLRKTTNVEDIDYPRNKKEEEQHTHTYEHENNMIFSTRRRMLSRQGADSERQQPRRRQRPTNLFEETTQKRVLDKKKKVTEKNKIKPASSGFLPAEKATAAILSCFTPYY